MFNAQPTNAVISRRPPKRSKGRMAISGKERGGLGDGVGVGMRVI